MAVVVSVMKNEIHEALTIQALQIVAFMRQFDTDADMIQQEFIGNIGDYERSLAKRENIEVQDNEAA